MNAARAVPATHEADTQGDRRPPGLLFKRQQTWTSAVPAQTTNNGSDRNMCSPVSSAASSSPRESSRDAQIPVGRNSARPSRNQRGAEAGRVIGRAVGTRGHLVERSSTAHSRSGPASESTFFRVLRDAGQMKDRETSRPTSLASTSASSTTAKRTRATTSAAPARRVSSRCSPRIVTRPRARGEVIPVAAIRSRRPRR
jgi:hypothetical protein